MLEKLEKIENRYDEISQSLSDPAVLADMEEYKRLMKEFSSLEELVAKFREYKRVLKDVNDATEMLTSEADKEFREMLHSEIAKNNEKLEIMEHELKLMLVPRDPNDDKSVIVEIRGGAGGEEAALFAGVLFRMYSMYAEKKGWAVEMLDANETEIGGFKEVVFSIEAKGIQQTQV